MRGFLSKHDIAKILGDLFTLPLYQKVRPSVLSSDASFLEYTENQTFWQDAIAKRHFETLHVRLKGFFLMEWLPFAPGRYFTETASSSRQQAEADLDLSKNEYGLYGKYRMIQGGIGSLRLVAKSIDANKIYYLGASSTGVSHEGIPVILAETDYQRVIPLIHRYGGCKVDLEGTLQSLQTPASGYNSRFKLVYDLEMPRYCLVIEKLQLADPQQPFLGNLVATAAIAFASDTFRLRSSSPKEWSWTYYSFHPCELDQAVQNLQNYVMRYSRRDNPLILADFDEHYQHFLQPIAVEFPVQQITTRSFDTSKARSYQRYYPYAYRAAALRNAPVLLDDLPSQSLSSLFRTRRNKPVSIFLCFVAQDKPLASAFKKHLQPLQSRGEIDIRSEDDVSAGEERETVLNREMENAQLILFLLSSDFIADPYYQMLIENVLERHRREEVKAILIYMRPVYYEESSLAALPLLPSNAIPVRDASWFSVDSAFESITRDLVPILRKIPDRG